METIMSDIQQFPKYIRLPPVLEIIPVSKSTWWAGIKSGRFPQPIRLGRGITMWRKEDIEAYVESMAAQQS